MEVGAFQLKLNEGLQASTPAPDHTLSAYCWFLLVERSYRSTDFLSSIIFPKSKAEVFLLWSMFLTAMSAIPFSLWPILCATHDTFLGLYSNCSSSGSVLMNNELEIYQSDVSGIRRLIIQSLSCIVVNLIPGFLGWWSFTSKSPGGSRNQAGWRPPTTSAESFQRIFWSQAV